MEAVCKQFAVSLSKAWAGMLTPQQAGSVILYLSTWRCWATDYGVPLLPYVLENLQSQRRRWRTIPPSMSDAGRLRSSDWIREGRAGVVEKTLFMCSLFTPRRFDTNPQPYPHPQVVELPQMLWPFR